MPWPLASDFSAMLQKPQIAFCDPRLQSCHIERDAMNQPRPWSGAFAVVYKAMDPASNRALAVRMFTSASPERRERYAHYCEYIGSHKVRCLVGFDYRDAAIRSAGDGKWYPLVLMDWVEGQTLFDWLRAKCLAGDTMALNGIAQKWLSVVQELGEKRIAHGDLSHSNVLVTASGMLKLVDYDGMCVPALAGRRNLEIGVRPYQHPQRDARTPLSPSLDHYSTLVIYLALRSLAAEPGLWARHVEGTRNDKLLFSTSDFSGPGESALFQDLARSPDPKVRQLAERLKECSAGKIDDVPPLIPIVLHPGHMPGERARSVGVGASRRPRRWLPLLLLFLGGCALASCLGGAVYCLWPARARGPAASADDPGQAPAQPANREIGRTDAKKAAQEQTTNLPKPAPESTEPRKGEDVASKAIVRQVPKAPDAPKPAEPPPPPKPPPPAIAPFSAEEAREHQERWASHLKVPAEITNAIGMKLVLIPPGEFMMGSPDSDVDAQVGELPQHRVRITRPFYLGAHEVTVGQFKRFTRETGYETDEEKGKRRTTWRVAVVGQTDSHPVVVVTWNDAVAFSEWLSRKEEKAYRLPREAEWEYACRGGTTTRWSFGDDGGKLRDYGWYDANTNRRRPYPVGQKKPNAWGLYDTHGNVEEWCADWDSTSYYATSPSADPPGPDTGTRRVARGGSFYFGQVDTRSAWRDRTSPNNCGYNTGFRIARTMVP